MKRLEDAFHEKGPHGASGPGKLRKPNSCRQGSHLWKVRYGEQVYEVERTQRIPNALDPPDLKITNPPEWTVYNQNGAPITPSAELEEAICQDLIREPVKPDEGRSADPA